MMVIDCHGPIGAPQKLWAYRALLLASRGVDGPSALTFTNDEIREAPPIELLIKTIGIARCSWKAMRAVFSG